MKKLAGKPPKNVIPSFADESAEANWWFKNRDAHGEQMLNPAEGVVKVLTADKLLERVEASKK